MRQYQVGKKRQASLAGDKPSAQCWLTRKDECRQETAAALPGQKRAGVKQRKY